MATDPASGEPTSPGSAAPPKRRSTGDVLDDHLRLAGANRVEDDIARNYAPDAVLLTGIGILRGHDGVRRSREVLGADLPSGAFEYVTRLVDGESAFLEWQGTAERVAIHDGADSFVIRDGLIQVQTIHYTVTHRMGYHDPIGPHDGK